MSRVRENRMHGSMGGSWKRNKLWQPIHGGPRETEGPEPGPTYSPSPRQLPTRPTSSLLRCFIFRQSGVRARANRPLLRRSARRVGWQVEFGACAIGRSDGRLVSGGTAGAVGALFW